MRPIVNPSARSPYKRYGKKPHRYSEALGKLSEARKRGDHDEGDRIAQQHSRTHGMRWSHCETGEVDW